MSCYHHPERESVAQCSQCGKALCRECASLYTPPFCAACAYSGVSKLKQEIQKLAIMGAFMAFIYVLAIFTTADGEVYRPLYTIVCGIIFGCVPFGWSALNSVIPRTILVLPVAGWLIYFFLKLTISIFIGWLALPYKILQAKRVIEAVNQNEQRRTEF